MPESATRVAIAPETKVGALLHDYPELEATLMGMSPEFERLKNPILRKTVAKVATLRQVAKVGGVELGYLVNTLRSAAGLGHQAVATAGPAGAAPSWASTAPVKSFDIRPHLDKGEHPLATVMGKLKSLAAGEVFELLAPFEPAPLIEMAQQQGFEAHTLVRHGVFATLFRKA